MIKVRRLDPNNKQYKKGMRFVVIINGRNRYFTEAALEELKKEIEFQLPSLVVVQGISQVGVIQIVKHTKSTL